jgi:hypothetical protein
MTPILTFNLELGSLISGINRQQFRYKHHRFLNKVARPDPFKLEEIMLEAGPSLVHIFFLKAVAFGSFGLVNDWV